MYYALIMLSVAMLGGCFALNDVYRKRRSSNLLSSMESSCIGAVAGLIVLFIINGIKFEFTPFTLIMSFFVAINGIAFTYLSFKALETTNLSIYSLFSMLGGMILPFAQGIVFYGEEITLAKIVCVVFIVASLALTVKIGDGKKGYIYYIGIFVLNGMSGVLSKLFNEMPFEKTSAAAYSMYGAAWTIVISGLLWIILAKRGRYQMPKYTVGIGMIAAAKGSINRVANFILVLALAHVDASVQYPMVTGGVMIMSTLVCFFGEKKPSKRELLSVALAFVGLLLLFAIPI
ncbi:MAG: hypothetical protein E7611_08400 [Ruminococcaceae bacterium]|nr:hypothetical protein [Oscillospiraceae bacterium]